MQLKQALHRNDQVMTAYMAWTNHLANALLTANFLAAELCCSRAKVADGQEILELGCGWGSLCLYVAARYPRSRVTAVSNSRTQKKFIENLCELRGIGNLRVDTADVVSYEADRTYDRVLSVEMFEHMKNYKVSVGSALCNNTERKQLRRRRLKGLQKNTNLKEPSRCRLCLPKLQGG